MEFKEGAGGSTIPASPDKKGLIELFSNKHVTFRVVSGTFEVYLDGMENTDVIREASKRGYTVRDVSVIEDEFKAKVRLESKASVRTTEDSAEHHYRVKKEDE